MKNQNRSYLTGLLMVMLIASMAMVSFVGDVSAQENDGEIIDGEVNRTPESKEIIDGEVNNGVRGSGRLQNPFRGGDDLISLLTTLIQDIIIPLGAVVAALGIIYSGFLFVTAQGNTEKLKTARLALLYSVIGAAILLGSWVIATAIEGTIDAIRSDA